MAASTDFARTLDRLIRTHVPECQKLVSVRALAGFLGVSAPQLSRLRTGVSPLTAKMANKFASRIGKTPEEREAVLAELQPFIGARSEVVADPVTSELLRLAFQRASTDKEREAVLRDHIEVYKKHGLPTDRLEVALGALRLQVDAVVDLGNML